MVAPPATERSQEDKGNQTVSQTVPMRPSDVGAVALGTLGHLVHLGAFSPETGKGGVLTSPEGATPAALSVSRPALFVRQTPQGARQEKDEALV